MQKTTTKRLNIAIKVQRRLCMEASETQTKALPCGSPIFNHLVSAEHIYISCRFFFFKKIREKVRASLC